MSEIWQQFHWLRPAWLLVLPLVWLLAYLLWRRVGKDGGWSGLIDPHLLPHLLVGKNAGGRQRWPLLVLALGWTLAVLALAGPTWERLPQPLMKPPHAVVYLLDLSPSMRAEDLKPDRLTHARYRLTDLINTRSEGVSGLVVYGGDAHVLAPLSDDQATLLTLVPSLSPALMPVAGSQVEAGVAAAVKLLKDGGFKQGDLVLITDGVTATAEAGINTELQGQPYGLSILGVGTQAGAPIPLSNGELAKDRLGNIQLARLQPERLQRLAQSHGGIYQPLVYDGSDISRVLAFLERRYQQRVLEASTTGLLKGETGADQRDLQTYDQWREAGVWLVLALLPVALLAWRRGWLLVLLLCPLLLQPESALAQDAEPPVEQATDEGRFWSGLSPQAWSKIWFNEQQRAEQAYAQGDYASAEALSQDPRWRGSAAYQRGDYGAAAEAFRQAAERQHAGADVHYNLGNSLARQGQLQQAKAAYEQALSLDPDMDDARHNQALVESLLEQQQQQQQQKQQQSAEQQGDRSSSDQQTQGPSAENSASAAPTQPPSAAEAGQERGQQDRAGAPDSSPSGAVGPDAAEPRDPEQGQAAARQAEPQSGIPPKPPVTEDDNAATAAEQQASAAEGSQQSAADERLQRWLRQLPDDPGGLLRRKFEHEYREKLRAYHQGEWQPPEEQRW